MRRGLVFASAALMAAAGALSPCVAKAQPNPPYPDPTQMAGYGSMALPDGWTWNGNIQTGGPPDGKFFGLNLWSAQPIWQGDRVTSAEAEVLQQALTKACASREFAEALVAVRARTESLQDLTDLQMVARVNWDSDPSGGAGRHLQTFEVRYQLEKGVCGAVQPLGLIDNVFEEGQIRKWILY